MVLEVCSAALPRQIGSGVGYGGGTAAVVATNTVAAATVAAKYQNKDELTLDIRLERPGSTTPSFAQHTKAKRNQPEKTSSLPWSNKPPQRSPKQSPSNKAQPTA